MKKTNKKNMKKYKGGNRANIDPAATTYNGPSVLPRAKQENRTDVLEMKSLIVLASSAAGVIDQVIDNNPSGYQDWSSVAALWDDYRSLSLRIEYFPYNRYSKTTTSCKPLYQVIDRDSVGALSSVNAAIQYESCDRKSSEDPWTRVAKMKDVLDSQFITTASPSATFAIKHYQNGYSASTSYGEVLITLIIQVRGRN